MGPYLTVARPCHVFYDQLTPYASCPVLHSQCPDTEQTLSYDLSPPSCRERSEKMASLHGLPKHTRLSQSAGPIPAEQGRPCGTSIRCPVPGLNLLADCGYLFRPSMWPCSRTLSNRAILSTHLLPVPVCSISADRALGPGTLSGPIGDLALPETSCTGSQARPRSHCSCCEAGL